MKSNGLLLFATLLAVAALIVGVLALNTANTAKTLALSEIVVEEVNSLTTPVLNEGSGEFSYLTMYDVSIANMSGPAVTLEKISKAKKGGGFLTLLKGEEIVAADVNAKAFITEQSSSAIKANPRLLKEAPQSDMGEAAPVDLVIEPGETKVLHLGVSLQPFVQGGAVANVALVSWRFEFDNGKSYVFRRGFPIYPLRK